uniref:Putative ovule protein n=1 Tax=Solanum chacoense TaxID=4108 RepID=A0A0V0GEY1_SOLCH
MLMEIHQKNWQMMSAAIFWCIWNGRNRRCLDGISTPNHTLKAKCLINLFSWFNQAPVTSIEFSFG